MNMQKKKWARTLALGAGVLAAAGSLLVSTACASGSTGQRASETGTSYSTAVDPEGIRSLEIDWVSGQVMIEPYDGEEILLEERSDREIEEKNRLHWKVDGDTLEVQFYDKGFRLRFRDRQSKDLRILLPRALAENLKELDIDNVSADFHLADLKLESLEADMVSGDLKGIGLNAEEVELKSVSGSLQCQFMVSPEELEMETVSGTGEIVLPEGTKFRARMESVTGEIRSELPYETGKEGSGPVFKMESVSGDLIIRAQ